MSNLRALYTAIAAVDVTYTNEAAGTTTVSAVDLQNLASLYSSPSLPVRLLLPMEEWGAASVPSQTLSVGSVGALGEMMWNMVDLMLHSPVGKGRLEDHIPDLMRYAGAYAEMIFDNVCPATNIYLETFAPSVGVYEYPIQSGNQYFGVECLSTWRELINA